MSKDVSYKNYFDGGVTTYHADGSKSVTYKNVITPGYTTYHSDGSADRTYKNAFTPGYTTEHADGSRSRTYKNTFTPGVTTYHEDGSRSITQKNLMDRGYSTYDNGVPPAYFAGHRSSHGSGQSPVRIYPPHSPGTGRTYRNQADRWVQTAWLIYIPLTLYVLATFFIRALPTGFLPMLICLAAALFFHSFYLSAATPLGFGTKATLFFLQTLLYLLQVSLRLSDRFASVTVREGNLYIFLGPALFLILQLLATFTGRRYRRKQG